jgi:hypothetical protein
MRNAPEIHGIVCTVMGGTIEEKILLRLAERKTLVRQRPTQQRGMGRPPEPSTICLGWLAALAQIEHGEVSMR